MNLLLLLAHSIAEYDDLRMLHELGYNVFSIGAYTNPAKPADDKRPALPQVPYIEELARQVAGDQLAHKAWLPPALIEWADVIIAHHYVDQWLAGQWERIRPRGGKRVIWRTCGQSDHRLEELMGPLRSQGLEIVRYSPAEERYFTAAGHWAGQDALIRFGKYPKDYGPWEPTEPRYVANVTQNMAGRGEWVGQGFWQEATAGLDARPAGPGSEQLEGGLGTLGYVELLDYLRHAGAYLYTGTLPAPYTLGLIEAMLSGIPMVSIGASAWRGPDALWEAAELVEVRGGNGEPWRKPLLAPAQVASSPAEANASLRRLLAEPHLARVHSEHVRLRAKALWDVATVGPQWRALLGAPAKAVAA